MTEPPPVRGRSGSPRFVADETAEGDAIVLDTSCNPALLVAVCPVEHSFAENIADLLNAEDAKSRDASWR